MAWLDRLSRTQKIILAVLCFPLLPFYLCYVCCCSSDEDGGEAKESQKGDLSRVEGARNDAVNVHGVRGQPSPRTLPRSTTTQRGDSVTQDQKPATTKHDSSISTSVDDNQMFHVCVLEQRDKSSESNVNGNSEVVTVEIHPKKSTANLVKKFSFGKGKVTRTNEAVYDNEGYVNDQNGAKVSNAILFAYPWDGSALKSMRIDLNQFKQLDAYASKVKASGSVEALVQNLLRSTGSDIEKLRAIWMWVTHHIAYDVDGYQNPTLRSASPDDVLRAGRAVCAGYSQLVQRMCSLAGVECKELSGYSKGAGYELGKRFRGESDHAWNAVRLAGSWHLLDATWGAGHVSDNVSQFIFKYNEFYFLTHPALFVGDHFPLEGQWQLLRPQVSLTQFEDASLRKSGFYNSGLLSSQPESWLIHSDQKTTITMKSSSPKLFMQTLNDKENYGILTLKPDGMKLDVYPPEIGKHSLKIYCKDPDSTEKTYNSVSHYEIRCKAVDRGLNLPEDLKNPMGPSWLSEQSGLHDPSQRDPLVHTADGRCSFSFRADSHWEFFGMLSTGAFCMTDDKQRRHTFMSRTVERVKFQVQLPRPGLYQLCIYGKEKTMAGSFSNVCNYLISCTNAKVSWPVFPLKYASWQEHCELVEPLSGVLPANRTIRFRMRVPGVSQVSVQGKATQDLCLDSDGFWNGLCSTAGCVDLSVMIRENPDDITRSFILNYQVEGKSD
ncbi:kyphoscoliosis peptidase-like isoform X2 [Brienomyrus brachyistius]|uniref:kyphoscoliosis peptidase-like isoform X2 n=1 Tax=Brienomyrus brachyistius TaxID=42636 RepID=UPI0020B1FA0D|nr:kyphoscoliosis peptidase-like isoform X2 [Brienomyrus brachyistius]